MLLARQWVAFARSAHGSWLQLEPGQLQFVKVSTGQVLTKPASPGTGASAKVLVRAGRRRLPGLRLPHCDRLLRSESDMMGSTAVLGILKLFFREEQLGESAFFACKGTVTLTDER